MNWAANAVFGKVVRTASEEVTLQLVLSKCVSVLLYGLEACPLNASDIRSLDFVINLFFMKLFKTTDIEIVKYCQNIFRFELPSVRLTRLKTRFLASYSSVNNSLRRHILIHGWPLCFCWYTLIVLVLLCLFIFVFIVPDLWWIEVIQSKINHQHSVTSQIFSSAGIHDGARWQFCSITHVPSTMPRSIIFLAIGPWPWPSDSEANFSPPKPCQFHNTSTAFNRHLYLYSRLD